MRIAVIGGGPAGVFAAGNAADVSGGEVVLFEKNSKPLKKLFITGKGRCNITNACSEREFLANVVRGERFLFSAINAFSPDDTAAFFRSYGLELKVERGGRVFPASDKSSDIVKVFLRFLKDKNVAVYPNCAVLDVSKNANGKFAVRVRGQGVEAYIGANFKNANRGLKNDPMKYAGGNAESGITKYAGEKITAEFNGRNNDIKYADGDSESANTNVKNRDGEYAGVNLRNANLNSKDDCGEYDACGDGECYELVFDKVVIACGGLSYPATGSDGDGYKFAAAFGHKIVEPRPALTSITVVQDVRELEGLSLKNVTAAAVFGGREIFKEFGEMLFTADALSGPIILSLSSRINRMNFEKLKIAIDLKPALSEDALDGRLLRDFKDAVNKNFSNSLDRLLPKSLIRYIIKESDIPPYTKVNEISRIKRNNLVKILKNLTFDAVGLGAVEDAIVTSGGVDLKEINPKTMESKLVKNLYFVGEVLDADALTGGFNLQTALSTGFVCGRSGLCAEG
ncbi:MAG: NAD(P)/FAD-dependent oxidoreductase [Clostridiales bacterium]|jgi:predicted flavoprotein YhiN|nr:NAD(P)/FAD-dependent oxidoreductase [Clostridiales bacterium]